MSAWRKASAMNGIVNVRPYGSLEVPRARWFARQAEADRLERRWTAELPELVRGILLPWCDSVMSEWVTNTRRFNEEDPLVHAVSKVLDADAGVMVSVREFAILTDYGAQVASYFWDEATSRATRECLVPPSVRPGPGGLSIPSTSHGRSLRWDRVLAFVAPFVGPGWWYGAEQARLRGELWVCVAAVLELVQVKSLRLPMRVMADLAVLHDVLAIGRDDEIIEIGRHHVPGRSDRFA